MITDKKIKNAYKAYVNQYNRDVSAGISHKESLLPYDAFINVYDSYKLTSEVFSSITDSKGNVIKKYGKKNVGGEIARDQRLYSKRIAEIYSQKLVTLRKNKKAYKLFLEKVEADSKLKKVEDVFKNSTKFKQYIPKADSAFMNAFRQAWDKISDEMRKDDQFDESEALVRWSQGGS